MIRIAFFLLVLWGCSPSSLSDFQHEGESRARALLLELKEIEDRDQLVRAEPKLKKYFESLIALMIEARTYQQNHPDDLLSETDLTEGVDMQLQEELRRVYTIEGAREIIERAQHEGLVRLDAYERSLAKKKELRR